MGYAITTFTAYIAQAINTKEDYEVLNGLFMGNHEAEEDHALRNLKFGKIVDMF
ncbi:TPA_asm: hypothetical protein [Altiarchaeum virus]|nr:TPA_asm: hypothetical protein [Altiarchaeum virus]